jgi:tetratricopeptide (TPR) repeat protein
MRTLTLLWLALFVSSLSATASAQVGEKIVVITNKGIVPRGAIRRVENVNGDWFSVRYASGESGPLTAWINRAEVIPFWQALDFFNDEVKRNPTAKTYTIRGTIWDHMREYDKAIADYTEAIRRDPQNAMVLYMRGSAREDRDDYDKAIADFSEAIRLDPKNEDAYYRRGWDCLIKKDYDKAISDLSEAIRLDPKRHSAYFGRGRAWKAKGEYDKAIADFSEAIRLDSTTAAPWLNRGNAWKAKREYDKAMSDYSEAIRLEPRFDTPLKDRAWLAAACPDAKYRDGKQAVDDATRACELIHWKDGTDVATLAAAYAEAGDFAAAVKWQTKARDLVSEKEKADYQSRLDRYKAHKAYRDEPKN